RPIKRRPDPDEDDEDEEEEEEHGRSGLLLLLVGGGVGLCLLLAAGGGVAAYFLMRQPKSAEVTQKKEYVAEIPRTHVTENEPAAWFVLLREARDLAVEAQRPRLVVEAINEIDKWFEINAHEMKIKALTTLRQSPNDAVVKAAGVTALSQVKLALADDKYEAA